MSDELNQHKDKTFETVKSALIGLLFVLLGWQYSSMSKLEDRVYAIQGSSFTDAKASALEDRISKSIEIRMNDVSNRLDLVLKLVQENNKK